MRCTGQILGETTPNRSTEIRVMMFDYVRLFMIYCLYYDVFMYMHVSCVLGNIYKDDEF